MEEKKVFKYFCDNCNFRKASTKTPENFTRCPFCGESTFKLDQLATENLVRDAVYREDR